MRNLPFLLSSLFLLCSCGLREAIQNQKQETKEQDQKRTADYSRKLEEDYRSEDLKSAELLFQMRRNYFRAISGRYAGTFHSITDSDFKPSSIFVRIQTQHDMNEQQSISPTTPEKLRSMIDELSFSFEIVEESQLTQSSLRASCNEGNIKPDLRDGTLRFTCQNSAMPSGRDYEFYLDDPATHGGPPDNAETAAARGASTHERLLTGAISRILVLNFTIRTPYAVNFFGTMERQR